MMNIEEEVASAMPAILERIKRDALDRMQQRCVDVAIEEATKAARDWSIENLVPEIRAQLQAGKAGMVEQAAKISKEIGEKVGEALAAKAAKTLTESYNTQKIVEALFRGY